MSRTRLRFVALAMLAALLSLTIAACGGDDSDSGSASGETTKELPEGQKGGVVTALSAGDVDYMDPGQVYYTFGYQVAYSVNRSLYYFNPAAPEQQIPDTADGEPEIADDNTSLTVTLKEGIKYAPPVNRAIKCDDIKYAFERAFSENVPNAYATQFFGDIVGAPEKPTKGVQDISGITCPDDQTVKFALDTPTAGTLYAALVMPITIPVPREYASEFDASNPSKYDKNVAFVGPYQVENDSEGKLTGWQPGKQIEAIRNPNWDASTDFRPAYLDSWKIAEGNDDAALASRRILQGQSLVQGDGAPPAEVLKQAATQFKSQLVFSPAGGTRYLAMNTTREPFDDINVRKAVIAGMDRNALRLARGGAINGPIAWSYLPPDFPGGQQSGGLKPPAEFDFLQSEQGNPELAAEYMKKAGFADGKYKGEPIFVPATNADPGKKMAEVAIANLEELGFEVNARFLPQDTLYTKYCNSGKSNYDMCTNVGFFKDFLDGSTLIRPTFYGPAIVPQNNVNWPLLDDPEVNKLIEVANAAQPGEERDQAWADANLAVVKTAAAVPVIWDNQPIVFSKNVNMVADDYANSPFMAFLSLK
jgi:peptide/nickel transport system substrate-binding protein